LLDEAAQNYSCALLLHAASENKCAHQAVMCIYVARCDCATHAWEILCELLDGHSFARYMSLMDSLMSRHRPSQSLTEYVRFMR
jgi:hypothetical protein